MQCSRRLQHGHGGGGHDCLGNREPEQEHRQLRITHSTIVQDNHESGPSMSILDLTSIGDAQEMDFNKEE